VENVPELLTPYVLITCLLAKLALQAGIPESLPPIDKARAMLVLILNLAKKMAG
jgi:hypothetical protein